MFKITAKTTKADLKAILNANFANVKNANETLAAQIKYAGEHQDTATRKDLVDLVKDVIATLGDAFVVPALAEEAPVVENSVKKPAKKIQKVSKETTEESADEAEADDGEDEVSEQKTKAVKPAKKSAKKADGVTVLATNSDKAVQMAKNFPETLEIDGETFAITHDIKTLADLRSDENADAEFEFAFYWAKRHLKQFPYFSGMGQPKSFPNDLDTCQLIYVSENDVVAYAVSDSTEALYTIYPADLEEVDGLRYCNGIEFQIYRKVENK